jgi:hypothetical protein
MTSDLTPRQKSVLDFVVAFQQAHRMAPTVREICAHLGLSGPAGIHRILGVLKDKGCIISEPGKKRSWRFSKEKTGLGIPLVGTIAAGIPIEAIENFEEELAISPKLFGCDQCSHCRPQHLPRKRLSPCLSEQQANPTPQSASGGRLVAGSRCCSAGRGSPCGGRRT